MAMLMLTARLGLVGVVPMLLTFNQPFGFNAILGLIGLAGMPHSSPRLLKLACLEAPITR